MSFYENQCFRCGQLVYQVDKIGPLKDFSFFHHQCFKCSICGTKLTLRTYFNSHDQDDKEVYCSSHAPKTGPGRLDGHSVGIRAALNVPKTSSLVNEQIRGSGKGTFDAEAISIKQHIRLPNKAGDGAIVETNVPANSGSNAANNNVSYAGKFDASALHIRHALQATELQRKYKFHSSERSINEYLDRDVQKNLEMVHRKEEDDLYHIFATQRAEEEGHINRQIQEEWEKELEKLASRFESELRLKKKKISTEEQRALTVRHQKERDDLEKNMTLKRDKKREVLTRKRLEQERAATAALVEKHSSEMLNLINQKKTEFLKTNSYYDSDSNYNEDEESVNPYPSHPPPPHPPSHPKSEVYNDPQVFADLDQIAINVAQADQKTFTDLVRQLVGRCSSDVEKARAIFRWITVKNLNTMQFDENVRADTPMALLRGIKYGTESYHVLFKRLCSYVGLHCMVIKGYSKSAGYQPGIKFEDNRFRNSWNAVYVAGAWRFVQCNWGARHLVNAKDALKSGSHSNPSSKTSNKTDSLRYEYDDHYFLTNPNEFIHEFFPMQVEWQLLRKPITLEEFEDMPFVRSLFFRYGLYLPSEDDTRAVSCTDSTGAATVRIGMPASMAATLIFHYNLKFYEGDVDVYDGLSLKRYVMQSVVGNVVAFRVHAPCAGLPLLLDIFANAVTPKEYLTGEPMKFKSVCKFKIICGDLKTVMVPLPDCASGEWGPMKAARLFGLVPLTHQDALIFAGREVEIQLRMSRKLTDFMAALHRNGFDEKKLARYVSHSVTDDIVTFRVTFVEEGQYGLDIYTRDVDNEHVKYRSQLEPGEKQLLTHCCKYLINSSKRN